MSCVSQFRASFLAAFGRIETSLLLTSYLASPDSLSRRRLVYELFGTKLEAPGAGEGDRKGVAAGPGYMYPGEYGREEVLLGVLEEAVEFAAKRGFTCGAVHQFLRLYLDALELLCRLSNAILIRQVVVSFHPRLQLSKCCLLGRRNGSRHMYIQRSFDKHIIIKKCNLIMSVMCSL